MKPAIEFEPAIDFKEVREDVLARTGALFDIDAGAAPLEGGLRTRRRARRLVYLPIRVKFAIAFAIATAWMVLSIYLSLTWLHDLSLTIGRPLALYLITFIAYVPGFMNAFLMASLLLDHRPPRARAEHLPGVTVLVPCYNESAAVADTIGSLARHMAAADERRLTTQLFRAPGLELDIVRPDDVLWLAEANGETAAQQLARELCVDARLMCV